MGINYAYVHGNNRHMLLSNGDGLLIQAFGEGGYIYLPQFYITELTHETDWHQGQQIHFTVRSSGKPTFTRSDAEARALIDPLGHLTLEEILHAAQQRMANRSAGESGGSR